MLEGVGGLRLLGGESRTPAIDKIANSSQLAAVKEVLTGAKTSVTGAVYLIEQVYENIRRSIVSVLLISAVIITVYIGLALMVVINRLPLFGSILESIGIIMSGLFIFRNLWTSSKRKMTFDRMISSWNVISGKKPDLVRTVSSVEDSGDLSDVPKINAPAPSPAIPSVPQRKSNGVDELRYLFLASQVELIEDESQMQHLAHQVTSESSKIGVIKAEGEKCDRCWNYSPTVGHNTEHPLVCDRCVDALAGEF